MTIGSAAKNCSHTKPSGKPVMYAQTCGGLSNWPCKKQRGLVNQAPPEGCQNA